MRLTFYLSYALRNLWRSRRWSAFAVFSVAAGVATMVALRSLGLSIADSLTADVRATNKGDITISVEGDRMFSALTDPDDNSYNFREETLAALDTWAAERGGEITAYRFTAGTQLTRLDSVTVGRPQFINALYIDPDEYPLTDDVYADDPRGVPLGELFTGEDNEVVVSRNLADRENIRVGDRVRVSSTEEEFVVRGIVPTAAQAGLYQLFGREALSVFFGFAYFDRERTQGVIDVNLGPNRVGVTFPEGTPQATVDQYSGQVWDLLYGRSLRGSFYRVRTTSDLLQGFGFISDALGRFIVVLGLGAMLLGGVGIINTMLVLVRRRTEEIAALKTFGVKGRQVAWMFLAEAFWIGLFGSLIGGAAGVLLGFFTNRFGADLIQQPLTFRLYPEAILFGASLGVVVSAVFGILPVLSAAKVRPSVILRPNEGANVTAGCLPRLLALGFVVLVLGWIAGEILPVPIDWFFDGVSLPYQTFGVIGVAVTLLLLFLLCCLMWVIVWLIGKIPAFGSVDLQLALRNLTTRRMRTAITLLALASGMFALSSIAFFGESSREILQFTLSNALGGNVLILPVMPQELARPIIDARLATLPGVQSRTRVMNYSGYISALNGAQPENSGFDTSVDLFVRDTNDPNWNVPGITRGRSLTQADRGQPVAVVQEAQFEPEQGVQLQVGDRVTLNMFGRSQPVTVEIVGVAGASTSALFGGIWLAPDVLPASAADFTLTLAQVEQEHLNEALVGMSSIPLVLTFDVSFFDGILQRLITQFSALPLLVGILSLGAAAVITANTVALATLERRRQMGVLRAIGLKSNRVLRVLLLENLIVSLLGALIGIGLSALGVYILTTFALDSAILIPRSAVPIAVVLVVIAVGIGTLATLASGSVAVRERVMNTLRYE